jgi:hypothetical protein
VAESGITNIIIEQALVTTLSPSTSSLPDYTNTESANTTFITYIAGLSLTGRKSQKIFIKNPQWSIMWGKHFLM